jgi:DNA-binding NarL/FixJ family response regulator
MAIRLLIADDSADFRDTANLMLSQAADIELVSLAKNGQEAITHARQLQPHVAIIDIHMPDMDGLTAIRRLSQVSPSTACMAMSYDGDRQLLRQAMEAGARDYLVKPFNSDEVVNAVRRVATRRQEAKQTTRLRPIDVLPPDEEVVVQRAVAYLRAGRDDRLAAQTYAELVRLRHLDTRTLARLAEIFLQRGDWHTLRLICERLEKLPQTTPFK